MSDATEPRYPRDPRPDLADEDEFRLLLRATPVLARLALSAWWRATGWTVEVYLKTLRRVLRAAAAGESPAVMLTDVEDTLREYLRQLLAVEEPPDRDNSSAARYDADTGAGADGYDESMPLRERGAELLRRSANVHGDDDEHPAYGRILEALAPDEARILRLLALEGPQPAVDVRTAGALGTLRSELVAPGLTMIAAQAGCRDPDRVHSHLNNLERLGLIWFSRESLDDVTRYQVLEAQPDVVEAMEKAGRGKTVRRSIHLTPFGQDFCKAALPIETGEIDALPGARPEERPTARRPAGGGTRRSTPRPADA